jgi:hypothetical protein
MTRRDLSLLTIRVRMPLAGGCAIHTRPAG